MATFGMPVIDLHKLRERLLASVFLKKLIKGSFWLTLGAMLSGVLMSLASVVMARLLPADAFGEYGMVKATIDNFLIFASMGVGLTTTKYMAELRDRQKAAASGILGTALLLVSVLGLIISLLIVVFAGFLADVLLNNPDLQTSLRLGGFILLFVAINGTQLGALLGLQAYRAYGLANLTQGLLLFVGLGLGAYWGGVNGALTGQLLAIVLMAVMLHGLLLKHGRRHGVQPSLQGFGQHSRTIYKFAIPASLSTLIVAPTLWVLNSLLVNEPLGYAALGLYSAVMIFSLAIQLFNGAIGNALLPMLLADKGGSTTAKDFFNYFGPWFVAIALSLPLVLAPELVGWVLGHKYPMPKVLPVLLWVLLSSLIVSSKSGLARELIVQNRMWLSVYSMGQWALTSIVCYFLLRGEGALSLAAAMALGYVVNYLLFIPFFIRKGLAPAYVFYNRWVWLIWLAILGMMALTYQDVAVWPIRLTGHFGLLLLLARGMYGLYYSCLGQSPKPDPEI
ncbi:MAG: oligosaccharide flippase family protein [Bacteroidia bacterium]